MTKSSDFKKYQINGLISDPKGSFIGKNIKDDIKQLSFVNKPQLFIRSEEPPIFTIGKTGVGRGYRMDSTNIEKIKG